MKKFMISVLFVVVSFSGLHAATVDTILIAGFLNQGADADDNINIVLTKSLIGLLGKVPGIQVVPYETVTASVAGNHLWSLDTVNMDVIEAMGLTLGAKKVVFGDYKIDNRTSKITGHYSVYNVQSGEIVMTRTFEGPAGMDVFDTIDGVVKKVTFALVGQEIALANIQIKISVPDNSYRVYINGQPQGIATAAEVYKDTVIAGRDVEVSLRLVQGTGDNASEKEVYRKLINVREADTFVIEYTASGIILVKAVDMPGADVYLNGEIYGKTDENGDCPIVNIPAGAAQNVRVVYNEKVIEQRSVTVKEGDQYILIAGASGKRLFVDIRLFNPYIPAAIAGVGFYITPQLTMTIGGGAGYMTEQAAWVPAINIDVCYYLKQIDLLDMKFGGIATCYFLLPSSGGNTSVLVSPGIRAEVEMINLFYITVGARFNLNEVYNGTSGERQYAEPLIGAGVRFRI